MKSPIAKHPGQMKLWADKSRFIVLCAGRRFGKSIYAIERLLATAARPFNNVCYVGPTRQQAKEIVWDYLKSRLTDLRWNADINESDLIVRLPNRSKIYVKSAEKEDRFRGLKFNDIALDEFSEYRSKTLWTQAIRPCLSDTRGRACFMFTPKGYNQAHDIYQQARTEPDWSAYSFKTIDSPFFQTPEGLAEVEAAKQQLSERDYRQEYEASFETFSGRIIHSFDRVKCNIEYIFNPSYPIIVGQDFNRSPMASALYQKVAGILIQFGEIFIRVGDTEATCQEIRRRYPNSAIIVHPDATGVRRTSNSALSDFDIMKKHGFDVQASSCNPRVIDRWAAVNRAYEKELVKVVVAQCPITVKDRETLCYKEGSCEPDLRDPMLGHMSDASDYAIVKYFPIIQRPVARASSYI